MGKGVGGTQVLQNERYRNRIMGGVAVGGRATVRVIVYHFYQEWAGLAQQEPLTDCRNSSIYPTIQQNYHEPVRWCWCLYLVAWHRAYHLAGYVVIYANAI